MILLLALFSVTYASPNDEFSKEGATTIERGITKLGSGDGVRDWHMLR